MRVLLLSPGRLKIYGSIFYPHFYPRLGLRNLAAMLPEAYDVSVVEAERVESVDYDADVDLVGISVLTPHARKAYHIADRFRERGRKVVLGGPHPSLNPQEAISHADAVVVGQAERVWLSLIEDCRQGALKPFYKSNQPVNFNEVPAPLRLDSDPDLYTHHYPIEAGRGCGEGCQFCLSGSLFGTVYHPRPAVQIVEEIHRSRQLYDENPLITFSDNLLGHPKTAKKLCKLIEPLQVLWSAEGNLHHMNDVAYVKRLRDAGCQWVYVETRLVAEKTDPRRYQLFQEAIEHIKMAGINLSINFTIGYDDHDESVVEDIKKFIIEGDIAPYSWIQLLTPWPGTPLFRYLNRRNRILTRNWNLYDNLHVVFKPKRMSDEDLIQIHRDIWHEIIPLKIRYFKSDDRTASWDALVSRKRTHQAFSKDELDLEFKSLDRL